MGTECASSCCWANAANHFGFGYIVQQHNIAYAFAYSAIAQIKKNTKISIDQHNICVENSVRTYIDSMYHNIFLILFQ